MTSTLSLQIGAVLLLAALMMYGSVTGFIPRILRNGTVPILFGVALLGLGIYRFWPELSSGWRTMVAVTPAPAPSPPVTKSVPLKANTPRKPVPHWKTTVIDDSVPPAVAPSSKAGTTKPTVSVIDDSVPPAVAPAAKKVVVDESTELAVEPPAGPPQEGKAKRAIKSVGRFLHIGRKKE